MNEQSFRTTIERLHGYALALEVIEETLIADASDLRPSKLAIIDAIRKEAADAIDALDGKMSETI